MRLAGVWAGVLSPDMRAICTWPAARHRTGRRSLDCDQAARSAISGGRRLPGLRWAGPSSGFSPVAGPAGWPQEKQGPARKSWGVGSARQNHPHSQASKRIEVRTTAENCSFGGSIDLLSPVQLIGSPQVVVSFARRAHVVRCICLELKHHIVKKHWRCGRGAMQAIVERALQHGSRDGEKQAPHAVRGAKQVRVLAKDLFLVSNFVPL